MRADMPECSRETRTLEQWRRKRAANLTSETGWLTLVGLYWLKEGDNTFGRARAIASLSIIPRSPRRAVCLR